MLRVLPLLRIMNMTDIDSLTVILFLFGKGSTFAEVMNMTDIFEGSIIRSARRLDEFLNQVTCQNSSLQLAITFP